MCEDKSTTVQNHHNNNEMKYELTHRHYRGPVLVMLEKPQAVLDVREKAATAIPANASISPVLCDGSLSPVLCDGGRVVGRGEHYWFGGIFSCLILDYSDRIYTCRENLRTHQPPKLTFTITRCITFVKGVKIIIRLRLKSDQIFV